MAWLPLAALAQGPTGARKAQPSVAQSTPVVSTSPSTPLVMGVELRLPSTADSSLLKDGPLLVAVRAGQPLSLKAVRRSIDRLLTTERFSDVVARAIDVPGGVLVVFELEPKRRLGRLVIQGNVAVAADELVQATRLKEGAEFFAERLARALEGMRALYRTRGYEEVEILVDVASEASDVELVLSVTEGEPTRLRGITVAGSPGLPLRETLETVGVARAGVLNRERVGEGIERLRQKLRAQGFYRSRVAEPQVEGRGNEAVLMLPVDAGPRYEVRLRGNRSFPDSVLLGVLDYDGTEALEANQKARLARRVELFYAYRGFYEASVASREVTSPNGRRALLIFEVHEGRRLFVEGVDFHGNVSMASSELQGILVGVLRERQPVPSQAVHRSDDPVELEGRAGSAGVVEALEPELKSVFVEAAYRQAASEMTALYRERGFLDAKVELRTVDIHDATLRARAQFEVVEGPRAVLHEVLREGFPPAFSQEESSMLVSGQPYSAGAVERERLALTQALGKKGYLFAKVDARTEVSDEGTRARVAFKAELGPQVRVGKRLIRGLARTDESVVANVCAFREGEVLDPDSLFETQRNLVFLGIFRNVSVRLRDPETVEATKDVLIEAKELPLLSGEVGGGYFLAEGPRLVVDVQYPNVGGRGINASFRAKANYVGLSSLALFDSVDFQSLAWYEQLGGRGNLALQNRGLLPWGIGLRLDAVAEREHLPIYRSTRFAALPGLDWAATLSSASWVDYARPKLALLLQYELEQSQVRSIPGAKTVTALRTELDRLRFPYGRFNLHTLRFTPTLDLRNDPVNPRRGFLLSFGTELSHDLGTFPEDGVPVRIANLKVWGTTTVYAPLVKPFVLALSLRGGRIFPLDENAQTIAPKRFFLGGSASMRGFRENMLVPSDRRRELGADVDACRSLANPAGCTETAKQLGSGLQAASEGGELFTLGKAELRFPAFAGFDFGVFFEVGNLWLNPRAFDLFDQRYVAGAGLRYGTPIGPVALDLGFNLQPDARVNEPTFGLHFNVGLF